MSGPRFWLALGLCAAALACSGPTLTLDDFETEDDLDRLTWRCPYWIERTEKFVTSGEHGLYVEFPPGIYPTLELREIPSRWSPYRWFEADIWAPEGAGGEMMIRIDDAGDAEDFADRFEMSLPLTGEPQHVRVPLARIAKGNGGRSLNLGDMFRVLFYLKQSDRRFGWYLDGVRLTK